MAIDLENPPDIAPRFRFWGDKWNHEYARNALLHYIAIKGLAEDCERWLEKEFPPEENE